MLRASATEIDVTVTVCPRAQGNSKSYVSSTLPVQEGKQQREARPEKLRTLHVQEGKQHRAKRGEKSSVQEGRQRRAKVRRF